MRLFSKNFQFFILLFLILSVFTPSPMPLGAQILPPCAITDGNCGICDVIDTGVNIIRWLLGILAATALFLFVNYGFTMLTSAGNKEKVDSGRKGLIATTVGLLIIMLSWILIHTVLALLLTPPGQDFKHIIFPDSNNKEWYDYCTGQGTENSCENKGSGTPCGENGNFCLNRCINILSDNGEISCLDNKITCAKTDYMNDPNKAFNDACHYLSTNFTQYKDYECLEPQDCLSGETIQGNGYCTNETDRCCKKIN